MMPLNPTQLETDLAALFAAPSVVPATLAGQWSAAMQTYATAVVPASTTVAIAATALASALVPIFSTTGSGAAAMDAAFAAFALAVFGGMPPASPPSPGAPGFAGTFGDNPATHAAAATKYRTFLHGWFSGTGWT
jgi:hypothetical protein